MGNLGATDLQRAFEVVHELYGAPDLDGFRLSVARGVRELVPGNISGYNEVWPDGQISVVADPPGLFFEGFEKIFERNAHQHPLVRIGRSGDPRTFKISDFLSVSQFHSLELYQDLYRRIEAEDQLAVSIPGQPLIGIAVNRDSRSFDERDREMLDLINPHIAQAHARVTDRARAGALIASLRDDAGRDGAVFVLLDRRHRIVDIDPASRALLLRYFDAPVADRLPAGLESAVASQPEGELTVTGSEGSLQVKISRPAGYEGAVLLLREPNRRLPAEETLMALGLTRRQAAVLRSLSAGLSTKAIAQELSISAGTVRKHLENIYARLEVDNRAAAVARAFAAY